MTSHREKMLAGEPYSPRDPELVEARAAAQRILLEYNGPGNAYPELRSMLLRKLLGGFGDRVEILPPFRCDYGFNISIGDLSYVQYDVVVLDTLPVTIGQRVLIGPAVHIYTPLHPMDAEERAKGQQWGRPVSIGSDCWIGGKAVICPGVTVGERTVIGTGSIVTRDIPAGVFAAGNPCRVIRELDPPTAGR